MKRNKLKSNYEVWLKLQRKIKSIGIRIDETCCEFTKDRLLKRLKILIKRLFSLNHKWRLGIAAAALFMWLGTNNVNAQTIEQINFADLDSTLGFTIINNSPSWTKENGTGDFNGDGKDDLVFSSLINDCQILFGTDNPASSVIDMNKLDGTEGFSAISNEENSAVTMVDLNADGFDDVVIGQYYAEANDGGRNYVLFGHDGAQDAIVDLENPGTNQLMNIYSSETDYLSGYEVFNGGDINGDGFDDLYTVSSDYGYYGTVIFANSNQPDSLDLSTEMNATKGFIISHPTIQFYKGDINGDGKSDLITKNSAYHEVLFGQETGVLDSIGFVGGANYYDGTTGFEISTWGNTDYQKLVDGVFDFNKDGFDDILIRKVKVGIPDYGNDSLYVVYGKSNPVARVMLDWNQYSINGSDAMSIGGLPAGELLNTVTTLDFNNDSFDDFVISTKTNNEIYLIYGNNNESVTTDLSNLQASQGFKITGFNDNALSVHKAGDLNADGYDDVVVMDSVQVDATDKVAAHIIYGQNASNTAYTITELQSNGGYDLVFDENINYVNTYNNVNTNFETKNPDYNGDGYEDVVFKIYEAEVGVSVKLLLSEVKCYTDSTIHNVTICPGDDYTYPDGTTEFNIIENTTQISTLLSQATDCDSIVTTNITVNEIFATTEEVSVCSGDDHTYPDGTTETNIIANTSHLSSFVSQLTECDSTITTNITVIEPIVTLSEVELCSGEDYTYPDGTTENNITANTSHVSNLVSHGTGCDSTITTNITVNPLPLVDLGDDITICTGTNTVLDAGIEGMTYKWSEGQKTQSILVQPVSFKSYIVTVTNEFNCSKSDGITVITQGSVADYTYTVDQATNTVSFTDLSTDTDVYYWTFGDGESSTEQNPTHVYTNGGIYTVSLTVRNASGECMDETVKEVQIGTDGCSAGFTYYVSNLDNQVHFTNEQIGNATEFTWEFGDGAVAYQPNPIHKYGNTGVYTVTLRTYNKHTDCMDEYTENIIVGELGSDCQAEFLYSVDGKAVLFTDNSIAREITNYTWDFDDGTMDYTQSPDHEFTKSGAYNVCLTIEDNKNDCSNTTCKKVKVNNGDAAITIADFNYTVDSITKTVYYEDNSVSSCVERNWNFMANDESDHGAESAELNPEYTYANSGLYLTKMELAGDCEGEVYKYININETNPGFHGYFSFVKDKESGKSAYPVDFTGISNGIPASFEWTFGDGNKNNTSSTPRNEYAIAGSYEVCLTISDPNLGIDHTYCKTIEVGNVSGIGEMDKNQIGMKVYPNPTNDKFLLTLTNLPDNSAIISILNVHGQEVYKEKAENITDTFTKQITVNDLPVGIYFIKVESNNVMNVERIVIQ